MLTKPVYGEVLMEGLVPPPPPFNTVCCSWLMGYVGDIAK
jgi:hypothetical protein